MSYPIQQYNGNNDALVDQLIDRTVSNGNNDSDLFRSFVGLADQMMKDMIRDGEPNTNAFSSFSRINSGNPNIKLYGVTSMNVTQISRGPDGRPRVIQALDERRMGPGGVWQSKKALRDADRGIDKMQVGYFVGDRGEIFERTLDQASGQYRQQTKRRGLPANEQNFSNQWRAQAHQVMPPSFALPSRVQHHQYSQQAISTPSRHEQASQAGSYNDQYSQQAISTPSRHEQTSQAGSYYDQYPRGSSAASASHQYY